MTYLIQQVPECLSRIQTAIKADDVVDHGQHIIIFVGLGDHNDQNWCYHTKEGVFQRLASLPVSKELPATVCHQGKLYALGGARETFRWSAEMYQFDPQENEWLRRANMARERDIGLVAVSTTHGLYVIGGDSGGSMERYDPGSDSWTMKRPLLNTWGRSNWVNAMVVNDTVYVYWRDDELTVCLMSYAPDSDRWTMVSPVPDYMTRQLHPYIAMSNHHYCVESGPITRVNPLQVDSLQELSETSSENLAVMDDLKTQTSAQWNGSVCAARGGHLIYYLSFKETLFVDGEERCAPGLLEGFQLVLWRYSVADRSWSEVLLPDKFPSRRTWCPSGSIQLAGPTFVPLKYGYTS